MDTYTGRLQKINERSTSLSSVPYSEACDLLKEADSEIAKLNDCIKKTNNNCEHFEREYYLRGDEIDRLNELLSEAVLYLRQGKAKFAPHTTNSNVDEFLSKFDPSNRELDGAPENKK
jgi:hypothetical protein